MGTRIKKVMGYGIELSPEECRKYLTLPDYEEYYNKYSLKNYIDTLEEDDNVSNEVNLDYLLYRNSVPKKIVNNWGQQAIIVPDEENTNKIMFIITPLSVYEEWTTWDDSIDYAEEVDTGEGSSMETKIVFLNHNPFPFTGEETGKTFLPKPLKTLADYLNIFTDEAKETEIYNQLKPCIVTYWS